MRVLVQAWVRVCGKQLPVGVHINTLALCLLQESLKVAEVMARHKNALALLGDAVDGVWRLVPETAHSRKVRCVRLQRA